jgi:2'-5' RNA ligase
MLLIISFKQKKDAVYNNNTPINVVCHIEHLDVFERIANELEDLNFKIKAFKEDRPFEAHRKLSMKKETKDANKEKTKSK